MWATEVPSLHYFKGLNKYFYRKCPRLQGKVSINVQDMFVLLVLKWTSYLLVELIKTIYNSKRMILQTHYKLRKIGPSILGYLL